MDDLSIRSDLTMSFGDHDDGAIGVPALTHDDKVVEVSYFYGKTRPKNIVVISSQAGCPMGCSFCELGPEGFGRNLTAFEMRDQALLMFDRAEMHGYRILDIPHKITVANSGEPLLNPSLVDGLSVLAHLPVSFKVSTVFPASSKAASAFDALATFASWYPRPVQPQISLISTSEEERKKVSGGRVAGFKAIREAAEGWRKKNPDGRKVNLSLIITSAMDIDPANVVDHFPAELFRFRFREYVPTESGAASLLRPSSATRLAVIKEAFAENGYEVSDWASPSPIEKKFGLAANVIRKRYLEMTKTA
jgi:hypothetical protein